MKIRSSLRVLLTGATIVALGIATPRVQAQLTFDNFDDGDDTTGVTWTHITGEANSTGQTWTFPGANTYRLQAPNNGLSGYGFVGSVAPTVYSAAITMADFVSFGGPGANPVFGIGARLNGGATPVSLTGYAYVYEPFAASLAGEMVLYRIDPGGLGTDIGSQQVSLDPLKDYRFELEIQGSTLHGKVYEIGGGLVGEKIATDAAYATGMSGVFGFGNSGLTPPTDFTIDNFAVVPEPSVVALVGLGLVGLLAARRILGERA